MNLNLRHSRLMFLPLLFLLVSWTAAQTPAKPPAAVSDNSTHVLTQAGTHVYTEPNGLVVLIKENHFTPVVTVRVLVRTGSMYEGKYLGAGISHLCEHLVHGVPTQKRTEEQTRVLLDQLGGDTNAATTDAWTMYHIDAAADKVATLVELLSDWTTSAAISQAKFDREHEVVTRELERGEDDVDRELSRLAMENVYRVHPVRVPVIGYLSQLKALSLQDVLDYYHSHYVPNNMIVGVVGDVDAARVHKLVADAFGKAQRKALPPIVLPDEPSQVAYRPLLARRSDLNLTRLEMDFPSVRLNDDDMYPLDLLSFILSQGQSSRLVRELRDKQKLVSSIGTSSYTPAFVNGVFVIEAVTDAGKHEAVRAALWDQLNRVMHDPVTPEELQQAKTQKISDQVFSNQTVGGQCSDMVMSFMDTSDPDYNLTYTDRIQHVTAEDVQRVARKYFLHEHESFTVLEPEPKAGLQPASSTSQASETARPAIFKLANGMKLIVKRNRAIPAVSIQAYLIGGQRTDSIDKVGLAPLVAHMLVRGTQTRSAEDIARGFESMGGQISSSSGSSSSFVTATVLAENTDKAVAIFADVLRNPSFPADDFDGLLKRTLMTIAGQKDDISTLAMSAFFKAMFPGSVFGIDRIGTPETVSKLTRDDLVAFYRSHVTPSGVVLAVYGDVDPDQVLRVVKVNLGDWAQSAPLPTPPAVGAPPASPLFVINSVNKRFETAVINVGFRAVPLTNVADADALTVLAAVMGGYAYPGGWLHEELRGEKKGLVYDVHAQNAAWLDTGFVFAYAQFQPEKVAEVSRIILDDFKRARSARISPEDLALAKSRIITMRLLDSQTNSEQAGEAALNELYGLGFTFSDSLAQRINAVTVADLARVAQEYFNNPVVVITTPDPASAEPVKKLVTEK